MLNFKLEKPNTVCNGNLKDFNTIDGELIDAPEDSLTASVSKKLLLTKHLNFGSL